jgi:hypothetical protein
MGFVLQEATEIKELGRAEGNAVKFFRPPFPRLSPVQIQNLLFKSKLAKSVQSEINATGFDE